MRLSSGFVRIFVCCALEWILQVLQSRSNLVIVQTSVADPLNEFVEPSEATLERSRQRVCGAGQTPLKHALSQPSGRGV